ncbi:hypothetical protein AB836_00650 [Rickettsiales bacterium (ex Bugula neritina AB1)]|nr:hypothetical protein AB836_00650 [Rickettsiales bacterium (ex Bugula neritina AB1)]
MIQSQLKPVGAKVVIVENKNHKKKPTNTFLSTTNNNIMYGYVVSTGISHHHKFSVKEGDDVIVQKDMIIQVIENDGCKYYVFREEDLVVFIK